MKALELAATLELNVAAGNLKEGGFSDQAAAELRRLAEVNTQLLKALERAQQDINWMLNEQKFLNADVFDYLEDAIKKATE